MRSKKRHAPPAGNLQAEQGVLACLLMEPQRMPEVAGIIRPEDFHYPAHKTIFRTMIELAAEAKPGDHMLVYNRLEADELVREAGGYAYLEELRTNTEPTPSHAAYYARLVRAKSVQRALFALGVEIGGLSRDDAAADRQADDLMRQASVLVAQSLSRFAKSSIGADPDICSVAELMTREFAEQNWIVLDLLIEGLTLLAGKPKWGKSWLLLALAIAVASGGLALGKIRVDAGDVLYLALEDTDRRLKNRLKLLLCGRQAPERFYRATRWPAATSGGIEKLRTWLVAHPDARLIIIDTFKRFKGKSAKGNQNAYDSDYEALVPIKELADEFGVAIVVVHHTKKGKVEDVLDEVNGSNGLAGAADSIIVAKRERGSVNGSLFVTGRDVEEKTLGLKWDAITCTWLLVGEVEQEQLSIGPERLKVIKVLADAVPGQLSPAEVADKLDRHEKHDRDAVRVLMSLMANDGQITVVSRGKYTVTAAAQASVMAF